VLHSRLQRVEEQVAHTLAELLLIDVKDPRLRAANVTHVKISKDLRSALVGVSCLDGAPEATAAMLDALDRARGWLRRELGARVRLKYTPELKFVHDTSAAHAAHIQELLHEVLPEGDGEESAEESPENDEN
jgi:ribosome-binding factor A